MPCHGGPAYGEETHPAQEFRKRLDETTALLCKLCATLEQERADWTLPPDVRTWWAKHKEMDKKRVVSERYETAVRSLQGINKTIADIQRLGGVPREALQKALADAQTEFDVANRAYQKLGK